MSGTLSVVATPIGNLEDITVRALRVLREATIIAAEDTRRTAGLLAHYAIATPTLSFHEHNARTRIPQLIGRLQAGEHVALVTDAGTPGVSDPGVEMVRACIEAGIAVDPIPGATAPVTAAIASGFPLNPLTLHGFPPPRASDRGSWLLELAAVPHTVTFFEAPHRVKATLEELGRYTGVRPICVGRELTKAHQEFLRGAASEVARSLNEPRGEFTVVLGPADITHETSALDVSDETLVAEFGTLTKSSGFRRRDAIAAVAKKFGRSTRDVYAAVERAKTTPE
jgi:16S rRNA (cytidine1402-2'-O)-methyltransferase